MKATVILSLVSVGALTVAACGGDDAISVDDPWARATPAAQENGAVYFELTVDHDDTLIGATVPGSVAADAQIHAVVAADAAGGAGVDDDSTDDVDDHADDDMDMDMGDETDGATAPGMVMREVEGGLALLADETVVFAPGGYHVMLVDLAEPLDVGDEFELTLEFSENDDVALTVLVEETAP